MPVENPKEDSTGTGHYGGSYSFNPGIDPPDDLSVPNPDANAPTYTMPSNYGPLYILAHETGHNVQSGHTHCIQLSPADQATYGRTFVDQCWEFDGGCFSGTASVPAEKGTIMGYCHLRPGGASNSRFIFGKAGEASYVVQNAMKAAFQSTTPSLSAITAPSSLATGASGTASVTNVGGVTYVWSITNGTINSGQGTNSINFTATANPTNVKVVVTNAAKCGAITDNKDITVTAASYNAPTGVLATAQSTTSVLIQWTAPGGTTPVQYDVYRSSDGTNFAQINFVNHPNTSYTDNSASPNTAYLYKVRSAGTGGSNESADSNRDLATTVAFSSITGGATTQIRAGHITQLRTAVDAVRALTPLGAGSYTDPTLTVGATGIKRLHIIDLRTALDAARANLALSTLAYGESITAGTTTIKASHITELQAGVQ